MEGIRVCAACAVVVLVVIWEGGCVTLSKHRPTLSKHRPTLSKHIPTLSNHIPTLSKMPIFLLLSHSLCYPRSPGMQLSEIEELIEYKAGSPDRAAVIREMWSARLDGMAKDVLVWQPILALRGIDANHSENLSSWVRCWRVC